MREAFRWMALFGISFNFAMAVLLYWTFYDAFINGLNGFGYQSIVYINVIGEADLEAIIIVPVLILGAIGTAVCIKLVYGDKAPEEANIVVRSNKRG